MAVSTVAVANDNPQQQILRYSLRKQGDQSSNMQDKWLSEIVVIRIVSKG
jgi:hypothetical protein